VVGFPDFLPIHCAGPFLGKEHDAGIWPKTDIVDYLKENGFFVLGDKGYVGCDRVYHLKKKTRGQPVLPMDDKEYNREISRVRVRVENFFAILKVWKVLSFVYRGNLQLHRQVFMACVVLTFLCTVRIGKFEQSSLNVVSGELSQIT
jgi:hypothetical protein